MILILILCHMNHCEQHAYCLWCVFSDQHFRISKFIIKYMFYICTTFYVYNEHEYFKTGRHTHTYYTPSDPFNWLDVLVECNWNTREWHDSQPNNCLKSFSQRLHKHVRNHVHIFTLNTLYINITWILWIFIWIIESAWCLNNCNAWSSFCFDEIFIFHFILHCVCDKKKCEMFHEYACQTLSHCDVEMKLTAKMTSLFLFVHN